jgi:hypothetical protein
MKLRYWKIYRIVGLFALLGAFPSESYPATAAAPKLRCEENAEIRHLIQGSWHEPDYRASFKVFRSHPVVAACYLINELRIVPETWIRGGDQKKHPKTMHVIWSLRALRYITQGLDFKGRTNYRFSNSRLEEVRKYFLRPQKNEVPFFAGSMAADSVYIAPPDAQADIIKKWIDWYAKEGATFNYSPAEQVDDWYF